MKTLNPVKKKNKINFKCFTVQEIRRYFERTVVLYTKYALDFYIRDYFASLDRISRSSLDFDIEISRYCYYCYVIIVIITVITVIVVL